MTKDSLFQRWGGIAGALALACAVLPARAQISDAHTPQSRAGRRAGR